MRQIKFRAWDKEMEAMRDWNTIICHDIGVFRHREWYELMQYTGLKDENGKEIYEGDIVRVTDDDGSTDFSDGGIGTVGGMGELFMWYIDGDVHNGLYDIEMTAYIEVIGNIYENPELIS